MSSDVHGLYVKRFLQFFKPDIAFYQQMEHKSSVLALERKILLILKLIICILHLLTRGLYVFDAAKVLILLCIRVN